MSSSSRNVVRAAAHVQAPEEEKQRHRGGFTSIYEGIVVFVPAVAAAAIIIIIE